MKLNEVIDLEKQLQDEFKKKLEAVALVKSLLANNHGHENAVAQPKQKAKTGGPGRGKSQPSPIEGNTNMQNVIWLLKNIGQEFSTRSLLAYGKSLDPKFKMTLGVMMNKLGELRREPESASWFQVVREQSGRNPTYYKYVGPK